MSAEELGAVPTEVVGEVIHTAIKKASFKKIAGEVPVEVVQDVIASAVKRASFNTLSGSTSSPPAEGVNVPRKQVSFTSSEEFSEKDAKDAALTKRDGNKVQLPPIPSTGKVNCQDAEDETPRSGRANEGPSSVKLSPITATERINRDAGAETATGARTGMNAEVSQREADKDAIIAELAGKLAAMESRLEVLESCSRPGTASMAPGRPQEQSQAGSDGDAQVAQGEDKDDVPQPPPETTAQVFADMMVQQQQLSDKQQTESGTAPDKMANNLGPGGTELSPVELMAMLKLEHQRVVAENQKLYGLVRGQATVVPTSFVEKDPLAENEIQFFNDKEQVAPPPRTPGSPGKRVRTAPEARTLPRTSSVGSDCSGRNGNSTSQGNSKGSPSGRARSPGQRAGSPGPRPRTSSCASVTSNTVVVTAVKGVDPVYEKQSLLREQKWVGNFSATDKMVRTPSSLRTNSYRERGNSSPSGRSSPLGVKGKSPVLYLAGMAATSGMARTIMDEYSKRPPSPKKRDFDLSTSISPANKGQNPAARPKTVGGGETRRQGKTADRNMKSKSASSSPAKPNRKLFDGLPGAADGVPPQSLNAPNSVMSDITSAEFQAVSFPPLITGEGGGDSCSPSALDLLRCSPSVGVVGAGSGTCSPAGMMHKHGSRSSPSRTHSTISRSSAGPATPVLNGPYMHDRVTEDAIKEHLLHHAYFDDAEKSHVDDDKIAALAAKLKRDQHANDYMHLHHRDVEEDHEKQESLRILHGDLSMAHVSKAAKPGQSVLVGNQRKEYMVASAKLAIYRGRALASGSKEFRERPITKVETKLYDSPYAQPREQTYLQRQDLVGSERILQEDLLSKGKDAHSSSAFMAKMGYQPKASSIASSVASSIASANVSANVSVDSQDPG